MILIWLDVARALDQSHAIMPFVHVPPRIFTQIFQIQQHNMSTTSSNDFSTESAMQRHENILIVKQQCMLAEAAVQEAHVALQARMLDLQMAQKEKNKELSMRSHQEVLKAQEEVKKKEGYRQVLVDTVSQLMENQDKALTRREVSRFGPLGRVPSSMLVVNEEIQNENPWLDADAGHYFRGPPPFSRKPSGQVLQKVPLDKRLFDSWHGSMYGDGRMEFSWRSSDG